LRGVKLCEFMSADEIACIKRFPIVSILPFVSTSSSKEHAEFGAGLQLLMIRDLMLVRNISVRGPEDTHLVFLETARELAEQESNRWH
jgi:TolB-like protein